MQEENSHISQPFNRRDFIDDKGNLTKLGAIAVVMLTTACLQKAFEYFFSHINSN